MKAQKLQIEPIDPRVERLAEVGRADTKYQCMIFHTEQGTKDKYVENDSELKKKGSIIKHLGVFQCRNGAKLLVRNSEEVIIPEQARREVLMELHSTHLCSDGMKRLARGKFYWTGMTKDIERIYMECEGCKENSRPKPNVSGRRNEVTPSTMETGSARELLCTDFGQYGRSNLLIIKDRYSGLLCVYITSNKTTKSAAAGVAK